MAPAVQCSADDNKLKKREDMVLELHLAVQAGKPTDVRKLLERGAAVSSRDGAGRTPLLWAIALGLEDIAKVLLVNTKRQSLGIGDERGKTPLHYAAAVGRAELCRILLDRGAPLGARDAFGSTPLHEAAAGFGPAVSELLVGRGADCELEDRHGRRPRDVALEVGARYNARVVGASEEELLAGGKRRRRPSAAPGLQLGAPAAPRPCEATQQEVEHTAAERKPSALEGLLSAWRGTEARALLERQNSGGQSSGRSPSPREAAAQAKLESALTAWKDSEAAVRQRDVPEPDCVAVKSADGTVAETNGSGGLDSRQGGEAAVNGNASSNVSRALAVGEDVGARRGVGAEGTGRGLRADATEEATWANVHKLLAGLGRLELPSGNLVTSERRADARLRRTASSPDASWCTEWDAVARRGERESHAAQEAGAEDAQLILRLGLHWGRPAVTSSLIVAAN